MANLLKYIGVGVASLVILVGGIFVGQHQAHQYQLPTSADVGTSNFYVVEGVPYTISKTVVPGDVTITVSAFKTPDGRNLTMAMFGNTGYATLDPNNLTRLESISFTGIVQNANGSATLTGVSRGLDFVTPYAASSTLSQTHLVGSSLILANTSAFYGNQFLFSNQTGTSTAILVFSSTTPPRLDSPAAQASGSYIATTSEFATIAYVNAISLAGAPNSTETVKGLIQLATKLQQAASTNLGSTGASLVLQSQYASSTPTPGLASNIVPITDTNGFLNAQYIGTSTAYKYIFANATTTTFGCTSCNFNGWPFNLNASNTSSSTVLESDGAGNFSLNAPDNQRSMTSTTDVSVNNGYATSSAATVPSYFPNASTTIEADGVGSCASATSNDSTCVIYLRSATGVTLGSFTHNTGAAPKTDTFHFHIAVGGNPNFTTAQATVVEALYVDGSGVASDASAEGTSAAAFSGAFGVALVAQAGNAHYTATISSYSIRIRR